MLRKFLQSAALSAILFSSANVSYAGSNGLDQDGYYYDSNQFYMQKAPEQHDDYFARDGKAYYIYAGYYYAHLFLPTANRTLTNASATPASVSFSPKSAAPDGFHSVEIGFGKELSEHFDLEVAYFQQFEDSKTTNTVQSSSPTAQPLKVSLDMKGGAFNVAYFFNPEDQFQVAAMLGVNLVDVHQDAVFQGSTPANAVYTKADKLEINPTWGMQLVAMFTPEFGFRMGVEYELSTDRTMSHGQIEGFGGFSYNI